MRKVLSILVIIILLFAMFIVLSFAAGDPPDRLHIFSLPGESVQDTKVRAQAAVCRLNQYIDVNFPVEILLHAPMATPISEPDLETSPVLQTWQVFGCSKVTL